MSDNRKQVEELIWDSVTALFENPSDRVRFKNLLMFSVGRVWVNHLNSPANDHIDVLARTKAVTRHMRQIPHIVDWLRVAVAENSPWLSNMDDLGRPKKLLKFSTIEQITAEADKAMRKAAQKTMKIQLDEDHETIVATLNDGYSIVRLLTSEALDRESAFMQHCIGQGAYDGKLKNDRYQYLSLRDSTNKPHVTIELSTSSLGDEWDANQIQGKQNKSPIEKYCEIVLSYLTEQKIKLSRDVISQLQYLQDINGKWHNVEALPEVMSCEYFSVGLFYDDYELCKIRLPDVLEAKEKLDVNYMHILRFPSKIILPNSTAIFQFCEIMNSPIEVFVQGGLKLDQVRLVTAPGKIVATEDITIRIDSAEAFPRNLQSGGTITLKSVPFESVDCEINAKISLRIVNSELRSLPKIGKIKNLEVYYTPIETIPDDLSVDNLSLWGTEVKTLPDGIRVRQTLSLDNMDIEHIPDSIDDEVKIEWSQVSSHRGRRAIIDGPATVGEWRSMKRGMRF